MFSSSSQGPVPSQVGSLTKLTFLEFGSAGLTGSIPSEIGYLTQLTYLGLTSNVLRGQIPTQIGSLASLNNLRLEVNALTGSIPSEIGHLTTLTTLLLSNNQLKGKIPFQLSQLGSIQTLDMDHNQLTGSVPTQLAVLTNLVHVQIDHTSLTGSVQGIFCPAVNSGLILTADCLSVNCSCCSTCYNLWEAFTQQAIDLMQELQWENMHFPDNIKTADSICDRFSKFWHTNRMLAKMDFWFLHRVVDRSRFYITKSRPIVQRREGFLYIRRLTFDSRFQKTEISLSCHGVAHRDHCALFRTHEC